MLIKLDYLKQKYNIQATGVLHVGASTGQEADMYWNCGLRNMLWIEAIPEVYSLLKENMMLYSTAKCINACISDTDDQEVTFNISNNDGQSSSFLEFGTHAEMHADVKFINHIKLKTKRIDTIFKENNLQITDYQFLNMDLQGAELLALKSMGTLMEHVKYAYLEVNKKEVYKNCARVEEIDAFLARYGFVGVEEQYARDKNKVEQWGDKFYIKK